MERGEGCMEGVRGVWRGGEGVCGEGGKGCVERGGRGVWRG